MPDLDQNQAGITIVQLAPPVPPVPLNPIAVTPQALCAEIKTKLAAAATNLAAACNLVVQVIDEFSWTPEDISELIRSDTMIVRNMERCGRQHLLPELVIGTTTGRRYLAKLSVAEQHKYLTEPLEVMTSSGDTLLISVDNLTPALCRQVFDGPRIRTLPEQRAWIETENRRQRARIAVAEYSVQGAYVLVPPHDAMLKIHKDQIIRALAQMT